MVVFECEINNKSRYLPRADSGAAVVEAGGIGMLSPDGVAELETKQKHYLTQINKVDKASAFATVCLEFESGSNQDSDLKNSYSKLGAWHTACGKLQSHS